jgi:two-component system cell cycle sensor histidine kinase/response regulator CckA
MVKLIKTPSNNNAFPIWLTASLALVVMLIVAGGYWFYTIQTQQLRQKVIVELESIAKLKSDQIDQWRKQRLADAGEIMTSPFFIQGVNEWLKQTNPEALQHLLDRFKGITRHHLYRNVLLVDTNGVVRLSLYDTIDQLPDEDVKLLEKSFKKKKSFLTDLHVYRKDNSPVIDVIAPLYSQGEDLPKPIGALVLQIDPNQFLYPLIQTWPVPSQTAESVLVRREGDRVMFLNRLRHEQKDPFDLTIPLTRKSVPAVKAVLGGQGVFIGTDYRGVEVLSVLTPIPDSSWFMVTKIDIDEAFAQIRFNRWLIFVLTFGLISATIAGAALLWQYMRKLHYKTIYQAEIERLALLSHFEHLVKYANDMIVLADENLNIIEANDRAIEIYGYSREEMLSMTMANLIAAEDMENFRQRIRWIKENGSVLAEAIHRRKDGVKLTVELSARAIEVRGKKFIQSIVRDIRERKRAEEALRVERERFQVLIENAPFGMVMMGEDGKYQYINPQFKEIFGYDLVEISAGKEWFKKAFPELSYRHHVVSSWIEDMKKAKPGDRRSRTHAVTCKDGEEKVVHFIAIKLDTGGTLVFCDDVSEQLKAKEKILESEERYRVAAQSTGQLIYDYDLISGKIFWAGAIEVITGFSGEEFAGVDIAGWEEKIHPDDRKNALDLLEESINSAAEYNIVYRFQRKDGGYIYVEDIGGFLCNEDGKAVRMFGAMKDISVRRKAEEDLQKLAMVIQYSSELVNLANLQGKMIFLNEAGARMLGIKPDEAERHHIIEMVPEAHHARVRNEILPKLLAGGTWEGELQYLNAKTGELIDAHAMTFPIKNPATGELVCLANVSLDITERKRAERERARLEEQLMQSQKLESIGRLAGGVAHDFNNMLAIIIGYADIVLKDLHETNPAREKTKEILKAAERARDLTRQLLAFARKQTLDMTHLELNHVVRGFAKMLLRALRENISIKLHLSPVQCAFQGDVGQIEQIILNIALNSQDAMPNGGTLVLETAPVYLDESYVKIQNGIAPGNYVMLGMSDTGQGMGKNTLEKIFEPFYTTKEVGKGTGLGLSTVYGIVKQHGGHIHVYSEPGKGTSFKIYFPQIQKIVDSTREADV